MLHIRHTQIGKVLTTRTSPILHSALNISGLIKLMTFTTFLTVVARIYRPERPLHCCKYLYFYHLRNRSIYHINEQQLYNICKQSYMHWISVYDIVILRSWTVRYCIVLMCDCRVILNAYYYYYYYYHHHRHRHHHRRRRRRKYRVQTEWLLTASRCHTRSLRL